MRTRNGLLAGNYWAAVVLVLCALVPYLALSGAESSLQTIIGTDLHMSAQTLTLTDGMANAGYALGTIVSVQLARRLPPRRLLVAYLAVFVVGSALAAGAVTPAMFITGHVVQGLTTSLTLIAAVPPLAAGFPASRLPTTTVILGLGIFGGVAAGPTIGGVQAEVPGWRPLFWIVVAIGALALVMSLLTFSDDAPHQPGARTDLVAVVLAGAGSAGVFFGVSQLQTHGFGSVITWGPLLVGVLLLLALLAWEYVASEPAVMVRELCTTYPVASTVVAMTAGAASIGLVALAQLAIAGHETPLHAGLLFLPELGGAIVTAIVFGRLLTTRWLPVFVIAGMALLVAGAAILIGVSGRSDLVVLVGSGLVGLGIGASVAPALFIAGFTRRPPELQRVYALLELLRGVAAFAFAPIVLYLATRAASLAQGIETGVWVCLGVAAGGGVLAGLIVLAGRPPQHLPDIDTWIANTAPALQSPPLGAAWRHQAAAPETSGGSLGQGKTREQSPDEVFQ